MRCGVKDEKDGKFENDQKWKMDLSDEGKTSHLCVFCMHSYTYALTYVSLIDYFRGAHSFVFFVVCFKNKKLFSLYGDVFNM